MQPLSAGIWADKYQLKSAQGDIIDKDVDATFQRVAHALSDLETHPEEWYGKFLNAMRSGAIPAGRIMSNAGAEKYKPRVALINCTVSERIPDSIEGIHGAIGTGFTALKAGCGIGYNFSTLRPKGAEVAGAGAHTSGPLPFMDVFDTMCKTIRSAGDRRGAQMGTFDIWHPDVMDFITAKRQDGVLRNFNLSVMVNDEFMQALATDSQWEFYFPIKAKGEFKVTGNVWKKLPNYEDQGYIEGNDGKVLCKVYGSKPAREVWDVIMRSTYDYADPGILFIDTINKQNNLHWCEVISATNPCVPAGTRLHTQYGMVKVEELYESQKPLVCTVDTRCFDDEKKGTAIRSAVPVFKTSDSAEVFSVETKDGYALRCTAQHKLYVRRHGVVMKLEVSKLMPGVDELLVQSAKGQFGTKGDYRLGKLLGLMAGDGHYTTAEKTGEVKACLSFWENDLSLAQDVASHVNELIAGLATNGHDYQVSTKFVSERQQVRVESRLLARVLETYSFNEATKLRVPEAVWQGTEECVKGYLRGLFQSDGTVNIVEASQTCSIRLSSSTLSLLKDIQKLLANFGVFCRIRLRRKAGARSMPDGKGGHKDYHCLDNYELIIDGEARDVFMSEIGFLLDNKTNRYLVWKNGKCLRKTQPYVSAISSVKSVGRMPVYCTTQSDRNAVVFDGVVSGNCGEQPLPPMGSCLLGSIDLSRFVTVTGQSFDMDRFEDTVRVFTRMLDNVVEIANLPHDGFTVELRLKRRHGMGITGYGTLLNRLGLAYGSDVANGLLSDILRNMAIVGYAEGIALAQEKGPCPLLVAQENREKFIKSPYISKLCYAIPSMEDGLQRYGCRFTHHMSIAPTGTISLGFGNNCSSGIEPTFAHRYPRNFVDTASAIKRQVNGFSAEFWGYCQESHLDPDTAEIPKHFQSCDEVSIKQHLATLSTAQYWVDSAISKTINVPTDTPYDVFKNVYVDAYKAGCKGCTTFRPNVKGQQGVMVKPEELAKQRYTFATDSGQTVTLAGNDLVDYNGAKVTAANLYEALKEKRI